MNTEILGVALQILLLEISAYYKRILVLLGYDPVGIARISSFES